ncbi:MAG TPA: L,D-transpeptidase [Polyangiaceae bacterium]|nr:L,D-transpeptidase [Polyangiaceae bacterium]
MAGCALLAACEREEPPQPSRPSPPPELTQPGQPKLPRELAEPGSVSGSGGAGGAAPAVPRSWSEIPALPEGYSGAWFAVTSSSAGVYREPSFDSVKIGYLRNGSRVPVAAEPVSKKNCTGGWYALASGGFACGNLGSTDLSHPEVKFATAAPNLGDVLPYPYARNAKNGTPLYRTVPSREQMELYEPYLLPKPAANAETKPARSDVVSGASRPVMEGRPPDAGAPSSELGAALADGGLITASAPSDPEPEQPWWQRENIKERLHEVKLQELETDADDVLAKRMVTGFYVAVDRTFRWNARSWYKTTKGLVTPSERFWQTAGSKFIGVELDAATWKLPVGWVYGGRKSAGTYLLNAETGELSNDKSVDRFVPIALTGKSSEIRGTAYEETAAGTWIKRAHIRRTDPGPLPVDLKPDERWIDVDLSSQTLVAFVGQKPIYATLISSGKESKIEEKDHRTPRGEWRVREKHITTTMDGDGSAAGDLPYSIEDVPYVMYYHRSYATHGAFWHANYGVQMSHGCVNLAPLDAKYLFFFADPPIPAGFHGVWATDAQPGTRIVIHD